MTAHLNNTKEPRIVLAITAYNKLRAVDVVFDEDEKPVDPLTKGPINNLLKVCVDKNIIRQADEGAYKDFLAQVDELGEQGFGQYNNSITFFLGAFSSYSDWLNSLAKLAGYPLTDCERDGKKDKRYDAACWKGGSGPFSELIYFINRTGSIGSKTSAKLAQDFTAHNEKAMEAGEQFYKNYWKWHAACNTAADGGLVIMRAT